MAEVLPAGGDLRRVIGDGDDVPDGEVDGLTDHDERYAWADEYLDVTYKLWEGSWDDGALIRDVDRGVYADASKIQIPAARDDEL